MKKVADIVMLLAVAVLVILPVANFNFQPDQISVVENRALAEPVAPENGLTLYMESLENAVDDRIGFRDAIMQVYNKINFTMLKGNHSNVIVGDEGWLFYREDLPDYTGTNINPQKTQRQLAILEAINSWCQERNITFVFAIGPNKSTIYSNYMPDNIYRVQKNNAEHLVEKLRQEGILVTYPKEALIANRDEKELYMRLDTHWNVYGARYMMDDIISLLDLPKKEFVYQESPMASGDLLNMLGAGWNGAYSLTAAVADDSGAVVDGVAGTSNLIIRSENADKIMCYRDSFHISMMPYYVYYFQGNVNWSFAIDLNLVEQERPKYLILSCVERYLDAAIEANAYVLPAD